MVGTNTKYMSFERLTVSEPESRAHFFKFYKCEIPKICQLYFLSSYFVLCAEE